jgi:hypothetical protein
VAEEAPDRLRGRLSVSAATSPAAQIADRILPPVLASMLMLIGLRLIAWRRAHWRAALNTTGDSRQRPEGTSLTKHHIGLNSFQRIFDHEE